MKLKNLVISGFKSFKDKTVINFDDYITGIVGPNGCGKSNVVDALFWVMGEMSAKHLRGDSMKDVIFSGTSKYNPATWAEVCLTLLNDDGKSINIAGKIVRPTEIQLSRKLYRDGESEYRINGVPCRLRDIQEVFLDTGAGAKSYSVIAQGEIEKLVRSKPEDRRTVIEEVAGITKFKLRKKESLRKIDHTQGNLIRISDLKTEIHKNLKSLESQAHTAERAKTLKERIRHNDLIVQSHRVHELLSAHRDSKNSLSEANLNIGNWTARKNELELNLQTERLERVQNEEAINTSQAEFNELSKVLATGEEKLNSLKKEKSGKESLAATREGEIKKFALELSQRNTRLDVLKSELSTLVAKHNAAPDFALLEEKIENLGAIYEERNTSHNELTANYQRSKERHSTLDQDLFRIQSRLTESSAALEDTSKEIEELERNLSRNTGLFATERESLNQLKKTVDSLETEFSTVTIELKKTEEALKASKSTREEKTIRLIREDERLTSLKTVHESLSGLHEGNKKFMKTTEGGRYKPLGHLVRCEDRFAKAVGSLLQQEFESLVSGNTDCGDLITWCAANPGEGVSYLVPCDSDSSSSSVETIERMQIKGCENVHHVPDILTLDESVSSLRPLLNGLFVVSNLDETLAHRLSTEVNFRGLASPDGRIVVKKNPAYADISFRKVTQTQGVVERNNLIEQLTLSVSALREECASLEVSLAECESAWTSTKVRHEELQASLTKNKTDYAIKKGSLDSRSSIWDVQETRISILKNRKNEISILRFSLIETEQTLSAQTHEAQKELKTLQSRLPESETSLATAKSTWERDRQTFLEEKMSAKSFEDNHKRLLSQIVDGEQNVSQLCENITSSETLATEYRTDATGLADTIAQLTTDNLKLAGVLKEKDETLDELKDALTELLLGMQSRDNEVKTLTGKISQAEKKIVEHNLKMEKTSDEEAQITRDVFEKYRVDLRKSLSRWLDFSKTDIETLHDVSPMYIMETEKGPTEIIAEEFVFERRYGQDLEDARQKVRRYRTELSLIGEINWQAIEDYNHQKARYDFLNTQEEQLKRSMEDLQKAIQHIDEKSRERFLEAFTAVNSKFEKVFPIIFGGGHASLLMTSGSDENESGVDIIAQPPGKKMQNINLMSGGEKALTALALIFSIFLVKPSPFCLLDEVDAPLDESNVGKFVELLKEMSRDSQFILITHNKKTMELNDALYGITMQEPGVSTLVSVQLQ